MTPKAGVHVLFTGGTISMRRDPVTGAAPPARPGPEPEARRPSRRHGQVVFHEPPSRGPVLRPRRTETAVDLHVLASGCDDRLLRAALRSRVPVVIVSRCAEGRVAPLYGFEGGGQRLAAMGAILGGDLGGPKARVKLMVALGLTRDPEAIRALFAG
jgi:L-asparaginase/Glu-tRNA(Gln) amidotransferase subunit D